MKRYFLPILLFALSPVIAHSVTAREVRSLEGKWQIAFDHDNIGKEELWHLQENFEKLSDKRKIKVPSCWELVEKDYEGVAYYGHTFRIPADWKDKVVRIQFDAVNFRAEAWLNDHKVGVHEGGFTPFTLRIDRFMKAGGQNTLTLRVVGPILLKDKTVDGMGPMETPQWRGAIAGGIWQPVRLIATGGAFVKDVFIEPSISDDTATFNLDLQQTAGKSTPGKIGIAIRSVGEPDKVVAATSRTLNLDPGSTEQSWTLKIPDAKYWSPDDPHLYRAEVTVHADKRLSDRWTTRFGLREFTVRDDRFYLNNEPIYLKATFFEGVYPNKLAYPDSREMAAREIRLAKKAGFNMIRPWRKPPPPMWLDLADEMGVMTVGSMAIECMGLPKESDRLQGWVESEVRETILRDRNRACVVQWELFNELKRPILKEMLHPMSMLAGKLDPTRLILDESGGWAAGANLYLPYESEPTKFNDIHHYPGPYVNSNVYQKLLLTGQKTQEEMRAMGLEGPWPGRNVVPGIMSYFSELGYGSLPTLPENNSQFRESGNPLGPPYRYHQRLAEGHRKALEDSGFDKIYPDLEEFCLDQQKIHGRANKRMIEAVRCNPRVAGYCVHALVAGDWIMGAGLLDLFRNPKTYAYEGTKEANQPRILAIRVRPRNVYAEQGTQIEVTGVNELEAVRGTLRLEIISENGKTVFSTAVDAGLKQGITPLFSKRIDTSSFDGTYKVKARFITGQGVTAAGNEYQFDVFPEQWLAVPEARIAIVEQWNSLTPFLKKSGIDFIEFHPDIDRSAPVFVSHTMAQTKECREVFEQLKEFITDGGTVVYLQGGGPRIPWGKQGQASRLLPINVDIKQAKGLWWCVSHIVKDHAIFDGLPVDCMMGPIYQNVWPRGTLIGVEGKPIAGSVSFDFAPDFDINRRHYYGPGETWWGTDVADMLVGKGHCILSQLRLVPNLGEDPVADRIFYNFIRYMQ